MKSPKEWKPLCIQSFSIVRPLIELRAEQTNYDLSRPTVFIIGERSGDLAANEGARRTAISFLLMNTMCGRAL